MKKYFYLIFAISLVHGVTTQAQIPTVERGNAYTLTPGGLYRSWERTSATSVYSPWSHQFSGAHFNGDAFGRDFTTTENFTTSDGQGAIHLGRSTTPVLLNLRNNLTGRLYLVTNQDDIGNTVTMDASLNPESTITGSSSDNRFSRADNAITTYNSHLSGRNNEVTMTLLEGVYQGGEGYSGMVNVRNSGSLTIEGASFLAGGTTEVLGRRDPNTFTDAPAEPKLSLGAQAGAYVEVGALSIDNTGGDNFDRYQGASLDSGTVSGGGAEGSVVVATGGDGLYADASSVNIVGGGEFIAGNADNNLSRTINYTGTDTFSATVNAQGGRGLVIQASGNNGVADARIFGGQASSITIGGTNATANSSGGEGLIANGTIDITNVYARAGNSASTTVVPEGRLNVNVGEDPFVTSPSSAYATVYANGGSGMRFNGGTAEIWNSTAIGTHGSAANANGSNSVAYATGGHGILAQNTTVIINGGTYTGADGGNVNVNGSGRADGGAGVYVIQGGGLTINGGTFTGGAAGRVNGTRQTGNVGVWVVDADLTIDQADGAETIVNGDVYANHGTAQKLDILGGTIGGDIIKAGSGITTMTIENDAVYSGAFIQREGTVNVDLDDSEQSKFFSKVQVESGAFNLNGADVVTANGSLFNLEGDSSMTTAMGLHLFGGSHIVAGIGGVAVGGNLEVGDNSSISLGYETTFNTNGVLEKNLAREDFTVSGDLVVTNNSSKISATGTSALTDGTVKIADVTGNIFVGDNALEDAFSVDFGWLTMVSAITTNSGVEATFTYSSLTNTSLNDLNSELLTYADDAIINSGTNAFFGLNSSSEDDGTKMFRYTLSQLPDVSESSFQVSQQVNQQIAARGTEFRSMNGFASTKPNFGQKAQPAGVAGPKSEADKNLQGWTRAYDASGNRDKSGNFASYDSSSWGAVIGVDKSFGNLLVGVAGGYARTDLDAGAAYEADVDTYYGSIYSTIGGESFFVDLAATYGVAKTEESNLLSKQANNFDSDILSFFIGAGKSFDVKEKLSITPEASLLTSYYNQEAFDRVTSIGTGSIQEYETWSYLSALGVNFATQHQIDWLNHGLTYVPEFRAHWLHEFNPDPDDFFYTIGGITAPSAVRTREEDLLRLGLGFDIWSWKHQSTKFEVDYDGLFSSDYTEHVFSGKITVRF